MKKLLLYLALLLSTAVAYGQATGTDRLAGVTTSVAVKAPVKAVTTANITLSGLQTVGGVALAVGDRVLVKDQSTASQNGIYVARATTWERDKDFDGARDVVQGTLIVANYDNGAGLLFRVASADPITIGTTSILVVPAVDPSRVFDITPPEVAAGVTPSNYSYDILDVRRYGADQWGVLDSTAAFLRAFAVAAQSSGRTVKVPPGTFLINGNLTHAVSYLWLEGAGSGSTTIQCQPTANGICLNVSNGASMMLGGGIKGIRFYSTDSTYAKTALRIGDISTYVIDDVYVGGSVNVGGTNFWSGGAASKCLVLAGRENITVRNFRADCDMPVQISDNPNNDLDLDHASFEDWYLLGNGNPLITVDTGVNITNMSFSGNQAWVGGTSGFQFIDTTSAGPKYSWRFGNVRGEQGSITSNYLFDIESNTTISGIEFDNVFMANDRNGIKLRGAQSVALVRTFGAMSGREALNVDATVADLDFLNCLWVVNSATLTGQQLVWRAPFKTTGDVLPSTGHYHSTAYNALRGFVLGDAISEPTQVVANNGVLELNGAAAGILTITDDRGNNAQFSIDGALHTTAELHDTKTAYSGTAATGSMTNVYWNAGSSTYQIQNSTGAQRSYKFSLAGSYVGL